MTVSLCLSPPTLLAVGGRSGFRSPNGIKEQEEFGVDIKVVWGERVIPDQLRFFFLIPSPLSLALSADPLAHSHLDSPSGFTSAGPVTSSLRASCIWGEAVPPAGSAPGRASVGGGLTGGALPFCGVPGCTQGCCPHDSPAPVAFVEPSTSERWPGARNSVLVSLGFSGEKGWGLIGSPGLSAS